MATLDGQGLPHLCSQLECSCKQLLEKLEQPEVFDIAKGIALARFTDVEYLWLFKPIWQFLFRLIDRKLHRMDWSCCIIRTAFESHLRGFNGLM